MDGDKNSAKLISVGSMVWKNATVKNVRQSDTVVRRTSSNGTKGRLSPPQPRAILTDLCNRKINQHGRSLRQVVNSLRETMIDVNFQLRSLGRLNDSLEKIRQDVDKSIKVNNMSCFMRSGRPTRERVRDNADLLLREEQQTLRDVRKSVEAKQWRICGLENKLADFRKILTLFLDRKSKVLDLVPDSTLPTKGTRASNPSDAFDYDDLPETREVDNIVRDSLDLIGQAKTFRQEAEAFLKETEETRRRASEQVTRALNTKIKETKSLEKELRSAIDRNRQLANRSVRTFHGIEHSWLELKGPESAKHLATHERADRPLVRSFHKGSVGNLPEIVDQAKGADLLLRSLREQSNGIGMLRAAEVKLMGDVMDKSFGMRVDRQVAVLRNREHVD